MLRSLIRWFLMRLGVRLVRVVAFDIQEQESGDYSVDVLFRIKVWATQEDIHVARSEFLGQLSQILGGKIRTTSPFRVIDPSVENS